MQITIKERVDNEHLSHYWYGGCCATIEYNGYTACIEANGDIYADYYENGEFVKRYKDKANTGQFYNEFCCDIKNDTELYEAIREDRLRFDYNNWWECFIIDPQGNFHDLMWVLDSDYLDDAIEEAKEGLEEMIKYIEEESE